MQKFAFLYSAIALILLVSSNVRFTGAQNAYGIPSSVIQNEQPSQNNNEQPSQNNNEQSSENSYGGSGQTFNSESVEANVSNSEENTEASQPAETSTPTSIFPTSFLNTFAVDIHYLGGHDINTTHLSYHFCKELSPNFLQCDLYNGIDANATLLGVELVVSEDVFRTFPLKERKLWHSHAFAVKNGIFVLPELSLADETDALKSIIKTYGKITAFYPQSPVFPIGVPQLAFGWVAKSQVNNTILADMDKQLNLTTTAEQRTAARKSLVAPKKVKGADDFLVSGRTQQYKSVSLKVNKKTGAAL